MYITMFLFILNIDYYIMATKVKLEESKPSTKVLKRQQLYNQNKHINLQVLSKELAHGSLVQINLFKDLLKECTRITNNQPNMLELTDPVTVIGDIHGQFYDLLKILSYTDLLKPHMDPNHKVVFLGDYVDRGINSTEVTLLLLALKTEFPNNVILLRGNHESRVMTQQYNCKIECLQKYNQQIYDLMMDFFDSLPIACIVNKAFFLVHGGISDKLVKVGKVNSIQRKQQIPLDKNIFCDLIWSDPTDDEKGLMNGRWNMNYDRECSIVYGSALVNDFLKENNLKGIIRAHEMFLDGYMLHKWNKSEIPPVITIFSAPNYCGTCGNKGAFMKIHNGQFIIKQFKEQQPEKQKFLAKFDVFSWTLPQILKTVRDFVVELTEFYVNTRIPELKNESIETKGLMLIKYAYSTNKIEAIPETEPKIVRVPKKLTPEEQRLNLFNRSIDYYAQSQKAPKQK